MTAKAQNVRSGDSATAALLNETGGFGMAELVKGFLAWEA